jgi:mono/diheme cytochrome c family protein
VDWLHVQTYAADHRSTYAFRDVLTGDPKKGEAYFNATCSRCHSATGDLKGIGGRYDGFTLQARWLLPRGGRGAGGGRAGRGGAAPASRTAVTTATVTLADGQKVTGTLDRVDDFSVSLKDASGAYHSFTREGEMPKVEINDPLRVHMDLLAKYTDADIHNITAYLASLK